MIVFIKKFLFTAPGLLSDDVVGVWRIDDTDHSFSTQPFRIKYARQDVLLSVMISFYMTLGKDEVISFFFCILINLCLLCIYIGITIYQHIFNV